MTVRSFSLRAMAGQGAFLALTMATATSAVAVPVVYGFEQFEDSDSVTTEIPGLTFSNTTALEAGVGLNEFEFPPRSGTKVVFDDGGEIVIGFVSPIFSVGAYFNYAQALSLTAYDATNTVLGQVSSQFDSNLALSGDLGSGSNEILSFADAGGHIARLVITGGSGGASFTMDDLTVDAGNTVPEPTSVALVLLALGLGCGLRGRSCRPALGHAG